MIINLLYMVVCLGYLYMCLSFFSPIFLSYLSNFATEIIKRKKDEKVFVNCDVTLYNSCRFCKKGKDLFK